MSVASRWTASDICQQKNFQEIPGGGRAKSVHTSTLAASEGHNVAEDYCPSPWANLGLVIYRTTMMQDRPALPSYS